jgi:hypothetical protein
MISVNKPFDYQHYTSIIYYSCAMKDPQLLGKLIPSHPDLLPIIENIREKCQIPEVRPEDDDITKVLLTNYEIDWDVMRDYPKNR